MTYRSVKRTALISAMLFALFALTSAASGAMAATQHWANGTPIAFGSSKAFTGAAVGNFQVEWEELEVSSTCTSLSTTGSAENPTGGGAAKVSSATFQLGCSGSNLPGCSLKTVPFSAMSGEAAVESGTDLIIYKYAKGELNFEATGGYCALKGYHPFSGQLAIAPVSGKPGQYTIDPIHTHLNIGPGGLSVSGSFSLAASSQALVLSEDALFSTPHWFLGSGGWTNLTAGSPTGYSNAGSMPIGMTTTLRGGSAEISCGPTGNGIAGSLQNPAGGGAGTANATVTFGACTLSPYLVKLGCTLQFPAHSAELSGAATETWKGKPAIELAPATGTPVFTFILAGAGCPIAHSYPAVGKLIATSEGDGYYNLADSEVEVFGEPVEFSSRFALQDASGKSLRLQP